MDKDRVIELVDTLDKLYWQLYNNPNGMGGEPAIRYQIKLAHELIENELNSKTVMPKVFDDWYNDNIFKNDSIYSKITKLNEAITMTIIGFKSDLGTWINCDCDARLYRCIDAIRYGYEVSNDD